MCGIGPELYFIELLVPACEAAQAFAQGRGGAESEVALQGRGVGVGDGDIAGLHGHELLVGRSEEHTSELQSR